MNLAALCRRLCTPSRRRYIHLGACVGMWFVYALVFAPLYRTTGPGVTALSAIPVILTGWLYGTAAGIASGAMAYAVTLPLLYLAGHPDLLGPALLRCACPAIALLVVGAAVGRLRTLRDRLSVQVAEQRRAEEALERRAGLQQQLLDSARQLTESIQLTETLARIASHAREILASDECGIYGLSPDGMTLDPFATGGEPAPREALLARPLPVDGTFVGRAVLVGHPVVSPAGLAPPGECPPQDTAGDNVRVMAAPLSVDGRPLGAIALSRVGEPYDAVDLAACEAFAACAAVALRNASLYDDLQREAEERRRATRLVEVSLREKEVLIRELYHRVKNNLQVIASLLELQGDEIHDPDALTQLAEAQQRIRTMALIHETLYRSDDLASVNLASYVADLATQLCAGYGMDPDRVRVMVDIADVRLGIDTAIPCGLLINELVSNSLKHGFPADRTGNVQVTMRQCGTSIELTVSDDGVGLPPGLDYRATATLGLQIVNLLAAQLHGDLLLFPGPGTTFRVTFPAAKARHNTQPIGSRSS